MKQKNVADKSWEKAQAKREEESIKILIEAFQANPTAMATSITKVVRKNGALQEFITTTNKVGAAKAFKKIYSY